MTDSNSYLDMFRKFGSDLGLPKFDVEKLIETQRRNLDALGQSAKVAAQGFGCCYNALNYIIRNVVGIELSSLSVTPMTAGETRCGPANGCADRELLPVCL